MHAVGFGLLTLLCVVLSLWLLLALIATGLFPRGVRYIKRDLALNLLVFVLFPLLVFVLAGITMQIRLGRQ